MNLLSKAAHAGKAKSSHHLLATTLTTRLFYSSTTITHTSVSCWCQSAWTWQRKRPRQPGWVSTHTPILSTKAENKSGCGR